MSRCLAHDDYAALFLIGEGKTCPGYKKERGNRDVADGELLETIYSKEGMNGLQRAPDVQQKKRTEKSFNVNLGEDGFQIRCQ